MKTLETTTPEIIISKQGRQLETSARILRRMKFRGFKEGNFKGEGSKLSFKQFDDRDCYIEKGYRFRGASEVNQIRRMLFEETDDGTLRGDAILIGSDYLSAIELLEAEGRPSQELLEGLGVADPNFNPALYEGLARVKNQLTRVVDTQLSSCRLAPLCKDPAVNSLADFEGKKILTMFPELAKLWCDVNGIENPDIEFLGKGIDTEAADYSNVIGLDVVESGKTARNNGLRILDRDVEGIPSVLQSVTLGLYARAYEGEVLQPVTYFKRQVERALNGMGQVSLVINVPKNVDFNEQLVPAISNYLTWSAERVSRATISPLADGGSAIELWVPNEAVDPDPSGNLMDRLEDLGATSVGSKNLDLMGN
jgi:ATP phosphoribosyltransferase